MKTLFYLLAALASLHAHSGHHEHNDGKHHNHSQHHNKKIITAAAVKTTAPGVSNSAVYFTLNNPTKQELTLISAASDSAKRVEIHEHTMKDGLMKMQQVDSIAVEPKSSVRFTPGGYHIMLIGVQQAITAGDQVTVVLTFENGQTETFTAIAMDKIPTFDEHHHH